MATPNTQQHKKWKQRYKIHGHSRAAPRYGRHEVLELRAPDLCRRRASHARPQARAATACRGSGPDYLLLSPWSLASPGCWGRQYWTGTSFSGDAQDDPTSASLPAATPPSVLRDHLCHHREVTNRTSADHIFPCRSNRPAPLGPENVAAVRDVPEPRLHAGK